MPTNATFSTGRAHGPIVPRTLFWTSDPRLLRRGLAGTLAWLLLVGVAASAWADIAPGPRRPNREQEDEFLSTTIRLKIDAGTARRHAEDSQGDGGQAGRHQASPRRRRRFLRADDPGRPGDVGGLGQPGVCRAAPIGTPAAMEDRHRFAGGPGGHARRLDLAWGDIAVPRQPAADPQLEVVAVSNAKEVTLLLPPDMLRDLKRLAAEAEEAQSGDDGGDDVAPAKNAKPPQAPAPSAPARPVAPAAPAPK